MSLLGFCGGTFRICCRASLARSPYNIRKLHATGVTQTVASAPLKKVTLIPGDGVWPELFVSVKTAFKELRVPVEFEEIRLSGLSSVSSASLDDVVNSLRKNKVGLKGIIRTPVGDREVNTVNIRMRRILDLYANMVHIRSLPGLETRQNDLDFIIIREQLEGEYSCLEHESVKGVVECLKIITRRNSERVAKFAFDYAMRMGRKTVTVVHKANIM
ncbi:unnamed protein product [Calicophoron daubneyi]|uniref:Isopropylmalate dehydrogenase-like domain-containing protein n=1 Tax=Calicophoron daubneyi TaxID=300641 RepID=A0AAV2T0G5_CALDB